MSAEAILLLGLLVLGAVLVLLYVVPPAPSRRWVAVARPPVPSADDPSEAIGGPMHDVPMPATLDDVIDAESPYAPRDGWHDLGAAGDARVLIAEPVTRLHDVATWEAGREHALAGVSPYYGTDAYLAGYRAGRNELALDEARRG